MTSTDTLGRLHHICTRRRSLTGWLYRSAHGNSPPLEAAIPLLWRGGRRSLTGWWHHVCTRQFPSTGGEYHPVRLRLPTLHRRGISGAILFQQPHTEAIASRLYAAALPDGVVFSYPLNFLNHPNAPFCANSTAPRTNPYWVLMPPQQP